MSTDRLFSGKRDLRSLLEQRKRAVLRELETLQADALDDTTEADLTDTLYSKYRLRAPTLHRDRMYKSQPRDVKLPRRDDPLNLGGEVAGTDLTVHIPFDGDAELLRFRPSTFDNNPPYGTVAAQEIRLTHMFLNGDKHLLLQMHEQGLQSLEKYLGWVRDDLDTFHEDLQRLIKDEVSKRKAKRHDDVILATALDLPEEQATLPRCGTDDRAASKLCRIGPVDRSTGDLCEVGSAEGIFINYRRDDSGGWAAWLYDSLTAHFGHDRIFKDIEKIQPGADWLDAIDGALDSSNALLAVIGKYWLTITDEAGNRRLDAPDDLVRREIERALERKMLVIPVLVASASVPKRDDLPKSIQSLSRRHAHEISDSRRDHDLSKLIARLEQAVGPGRASDQPPLGRSVVRDYAGSHFYIDEGGKRHALPDDATAAFFGAGRREDQVASEILARHPVEEPLESVYECELLYVDPGPHIYALVNGKTKYLGIPELTKWGRQHEEDWRHVSEVEFRKYPSWD